jgi:ribonuclease VapC
LIVDASALIALIENEPPHAAAVAAALASYSAARIGAPTATECLIVLTARHGPKGRTAFERLRAEINLGVVDFTGEHALAAQRAYLRYGKGRHRAGLNFGDCMTYAVATVAREPLLAVGDDFTHTDLEFDGGVVGHWPAS